MENEMMEMERTEQVEEFVEFEEKTDFSDCPTSEPEAKEGNGFGALLTVGILAAGGAAIYAGKKWILPKLKKAKENRDKKHAEKVRKEFIALKEKGVYNSYAEAKGEDESKPKTKVSKAKTTKTTTKKSSSKKSETKNDD